MAANVPERPGLVRRARRRLSRDTTSRADATLSQATFEYAATHAGSAVASLTTLRRIRSRTPADSNAFAADASTRASGPRPRVCTRAHTLADPGSITYRRSMQSSSAASLLLLLTHRLLCGGITT